MAWKGIQCLKSPLKMFEGIEEFISFFKTIGSGCLYIHMKCSLSSKRSEKKLSVHFLGVFWFLMENQCLKHKLHSRRMASSANSRSQDTEGGKALTWKMSASLWMNTALHPLEICPGPFLSYSTIINFNYKKYVCILAQIRVPDTRSTFFF